MSGIRVDLELVEDLVARMGAFEQHVDALLDEVDARMKRMHAVWSGAAAAEHAAAHARWSAGAREMQQALTVLRSIAATARENYAAAVAANLAMWG